MRVRYQMAGQNNSTAECDMSEKKAHQLYGQLETNGLCEWAELIGEDDENYMNVIESFDHIKQARFIYSVFNGRVK